jgi:hypothetical protein
VNKKKQKNCIHLPMAGTVPDTATPRAMGKSFFASFFPKKEALADA